MGDTNEMKEQISYFKNHNIAVHIRKKNGRFYNGKILELAGDMIILEDEKLGSIPIYFIEIKFIEKRKEKNG
ncbi:hypothetical protein LCGC14_2767150 [marine sediment metagenome]|uniref:LSM domain-containing protein n=1 Tax=marine sediment metagenome TaxID=412755 RepID=A0A0F8YX71_9ZZZZ